MTAIKEIKKIPKKWKDDPIKLEKELTIAWTLIRTLKNQIDGLKKMNTLLVKKNKDSEAKLLAEQKAHQESKKDFATQSITRNNFIKNLITETSNARSYAKKIHNEISKLEEVSKSFQGKLKKGDVNTIRNCLNELHKNLGQLELKETYELIHESFWQWIKSLEGVENEKEVNQPPTTSVVK